MSTKIACDKVEVDAIKEMNDRDLVVDLLSSEKAITTNTATALTEASNDSLHNEILDFFDTVKDIQAETYELAWNFGWYTLEEAETTKVKQKEKDLQTKLDELNN